MNLFSEVKIYNLGIYFTKEYKHFHTKLSLRCVFPFSFSPKNKQPNKQTQKEGEEENLCQWNLRPVGGSKSKDLKETQQGT